MDDPDETEKNNHVSESADILARNLSQMFEYAGKAAAAYIKPLETGERSIIDVDQISEITKTISKVSHYWMSDPGRLAEAQNKLFSSYIAILENAVNRDADHAPKAVSDKRFSDPQWSENQLFDLIKQFYLSSSHWAKDMVEDAEDLDPHTRHKADFYVTQISNALSPSNFLITNPEALREAVNTKGESLVKGMRMLAEDIEAGNGSLKIRHSDRTHFEVGRDLALTPGKIIAQNGLRQLIQYTPTTDKVLKRPLLIIPPWINKFYILDLNPQKSFIKWAVDQGHTVFVVSWVNPDERQALKNFDEYMQEGILENLDIIEEITGEPDVNAIGYCVGGTLLSVTLAYMATINDHRIATATLFTTQVDFTQAGDLGVFVDDEQLKHLEAKMAEKGYLEGSSMATAFNMLRSNDLVWPYVINNYLKGRETFPFDLLFWNSDSTRMPAANHSFYLRNCYHENNLSRGKMVIKDRTLDLSNVQIPIYNLATREDHIAPAQSVFTGSQCFGGSVTFVLSGSGHIAGVVNPPEKGKYQYWTGDAPDGDFNAWFAKATETAGSWWPNWQLWIEGHDNRRINARMPGTTSYPALEDAPGHYVKIKS